jgi:hypothetical protein
MKHGLERASVTSEEFAGISENLQKMNGRNKINVRYPWALGRRNSSPPRALAKKRKR